MASSEHANNNDDPKWTLKFDPFKALGVSSNNPEPDEIRKAYITQIRVSHPDKAKGRDEASLAKKLTAAYNFLKNKDVKTLKEVAESLRNTNISDGLTDCDLSHVLVDKTKAEHYRRLFNAHVDVAKNTHFKDNFQSFYTQVFENVSTQPEVDSVNSYHCHLCEEDFIQVEHHVELVYAPYKEYVTTDAEPGFWAYLEHIFDKEFSAIPIASMKSSILLGQKMSHYLVTDCNYLPGARFANLRNTVMAPFLSKTTIY